MSKQRIIKDEIWDDEWFYDLDPSEKLIWIFLLTNPRANIAGVYQINLRWMANLTGFDKDVIKTTLERFEKAGKILVKSSWMVVLNFHKHQSNNPKVESGVIRILSSLPLEIKRLLPMDSLCIAYPTLLNSTLLNLSDCETDVSQESSTSKKKTMIKAYNENTHSDDLPTVGDDGVIEKEKPRVKHICYTIYKLFEEITGNYPLNWNVNKSQRIACENLEKEHGVEQVKKALQFYMENKEEKWCPKILSPWDLDSKWKKLYNYKEENG